MKKRQLIPLFCAALAMMSCSDSKSSVDDVIDLGGGGSTSEKSEEYYAGGKLGTTTLQEQPSRLVRHSLSATSIPIPMEHSLVLVRSMYVRVASIAILHTVMASARSATDTQIWVTDTCWLSTTSRPTPTSTL